VVFDPFLRLLLLRHYEYELNVPLAALSACVEDRHIANCGQQRPFVQSERLIQRICCSGYATLRRHDLHDRWPDAAKKGCFISTHLLQRHGIHDRVRTACKCARKGCSLGPCNSASSNTRVSMIRIPFLGVRNMKTGSVGV
jgi:hypothetical protein